jgi:type IV pilus assembly protein PilM
MRLSLKRTNAVTGLEIEAGTVAALEARVNGTAAVAASGIARLEPGLFEDGEVIDAEKLGAALGALFARHKLPKDVRIGVANQRLAMRVLQLPPIEDTKELDTAVRFKAAEELPMPLDQAVLDFQVISRASPQEGADRIAVAVVAARRDMISGFVEAARRGGLRPVGIDLSAFAMVRALAGEQAGRQGSRVDSENPVEAAVLYCNLGELANLAVAQGSACSFARVAPFGLEPIARGLAERTGLTRAHAHQWLAHVGTAQPVEAIDGDSATVAAAREALEDGASKLIDELRLTLEFHSGQEAAPQVERVVFSGAGTAIEGLADLLGEGVELPYTIARPSATAALDDAAAARLTVAYGLALES